MPQPRCDQCIGRALRTQRDFGGAFGHARVMRIACERKIRLVSGRRLAALQRQFGRQHLEHDLAVQCALGQILRFIVHSSRRSGLRRGGNHFGRS